MSITKRFMSAYRQHGRIRSVGRTGRSHVLGAAQMIGCWSLNTWKLEFRKGFFPGKTCKRFACKRNYFVLQSETAIFPVGESTTWNASNVIKWAMLKGNYFIFSCVSSSARVFNCLNLCSCWIFFSIFWDVFHCE